MATIVFPDDPPVSVTGSRKASDHLAWLQDVNEAIKDLQGAVRSLGGNEDGVFSFNPYWQDSLEVVPTAPVSLKVTMSLGAGILDKIPFDVTVAQTSAFLVAPLVDPRIDTVAIDALTATMVIHTGVEGAVPVAPTVDDGELKLAEIDWAVGDTAIDDPAGAGEAGITDSRTFNYHHAAMIPGGATIGYEQISAGSITPDRGHVHVIPEFAAPDNLDTIDATNFPDDALLLLHTFGSDAITLRSAQDNIYLSGGQDFVMDNAEHSILLRWAFGAGWQEVWRSYDADASGQESFAAYWGVPLLAGGSVFAGSIEFAGDVTVSTANGINYDPLGDVDVDLITVDVTGTPKLWWDEAPGQFVFSTAVDVDGAFTAGTIASDAGVSGTTFNGTQAILDSGGASVIQEWDNDAYGSANVNHKYQMFGFSSLLMSFFGAGTNDTVTSRFTAGTGGHNVEISGDLDVGDALDVGGNIALDGNTTIDAYSAAGATVLTILNSDATYKASLYVEDNVTCLGGVFGAAATLSAASPLIFGSGMGNSSKDPTSDAPADWVQISIGGTTYYLPAYAAS